MTPAHLILGNGSNEVLEFIGHALIAPGAEVVVSQYCFAVYPIVTALFGGKLVVVPAKAYGHDLDAMLAAITPNTRVIFVASPNNPTGTTSSREDLARFVNTVPDDVLALWRGNAGADAAQAADSGAQQQTQPFRLWWYMMLLVFAVAIAESLLADRYLGAQQQEEGL